MTTSVKLKNEVPLKNSLKMFNIEGMIISLIVAELKAIPNISTQINNPEIVDRVCNLIENNVKNNKKLIDKKGMAVKIISQIFDGNINASLIEKQIDYLFHNKLIKKTTFKKAVFNAVAGYLKKKLSI